MTERHHTIIFVPHARARFRQFRLSSRALIAVGSCVLLSALIGITSTVLWLRSARTTREVSALVSENRSLRDRTRVLNGKLETLERGLAEFEERTRRLSIVAGLTGIHDSGTGGVGGLSAIPVDPGSSSEMGLAEAARRGVLLSDRLAVIEKSLLSQADHLALTPTLTPSVGILTAGFGGRSDPFTGRQDFHTGIDISTPTGSKIIAPASGTIVGVGWKAGYGRFIEVAHGYGIKTFYGHLEATRVTEGQRVRRGDLIGLTGSTGRSTGPHLHYEVRVGGKPVNPLDYVLNAF